MKKTFLLLLFCISVFSFDEKITDKFQIQDSTKISAYGTFIYQEPRITNAGFIESNLDLYYAENGPTGIVYYPKFSYVPGFKLGLETNYFGNFGCNLDYTFMGSNGRKNIIGFPPEQSVELLPIHFRGGGGQQNTQLADSLFQIFYNLINLNFFNTYKFSNCLNIKYFFGISSAWNNQKNLVHYLFFDNTSPYKLVSVNLSQKYLGFGFNAGIKTNWFLNNNWSIYTNSYLMNLWSKYKTGFKEIDYPYVDEILQDTGIVSQNYGSKQYGIQNVLDLELGIEYLKDFNQSNARLEISVGWEQQVWINQTFYLPKSGNLTLQGLNTKLGLSF